MIFESFTLLYISNDISLVFRVDYMYRVDVS